MTHLTALSLGAGVQSTALLLLAAEGRIDKPDIAVFADTGWEPKAVYEHLDRLEREVATPAGIKVIRVRNTGGTGQGIRADALSEKTRFFRIPVFMRFTEEAEQYDAKARPMILRRSCTHTYKIEPIHREYRRQLGATISESGRVGSVPNGSHVVQQIGISTDELQRAKDSRVSWITNSYPLLDLGWSRTVCMDYLSSVGWGSTTKSACIGCPFHSRDEWTRLHDEDPEGWADAVDFDRQIRKGPKRERVDGTRWPAEFFVHSSGLPLEDITLKRDTSGKQTDIFDQLAMAGDGWSCSPHGCASEEAEFREAMISAGGITIDNVAEEGEDDETD